MSQRSEQDRDPSVSAGVQPTQRTLRPDSRATGPLAIVGGCGHVGLPLGLAFAKRGYQVTLVDANAQRVAQVNRGSMPFHEDNAAALLVEVVASRLLTATSETSVLADASAIIVTIGTPVDEFLDPSIVASDRSLETLLAQVRPG